MNDLFDQVLAFVIGGGLVGILDFFLRWRANRDLAKQSDVTRAFALIDQLQEDNDRLRNRLREFEAKNDERERELSGLRVGVLILIDQLEQMGVKPRWTPDRVMRFQVAEVSAEQV